MSGPERGAAQILVCAGNARPSLFSQPELTSLLICASPILPSFKMHPEVASTTTPTLPGIVRKEHGLWGQSPVQILALYPITVGEESCLSEPVSLLCIYDNNHVDSGVRWAECNLAFAI